MRRRLCALTAALMLFGGGCRGPAANWSDVARLRPIQTLGFDREDGRTVVSAAAGVTSSGKTPPVAAQAGGSIESALTALQNAFPEGEPYYAHVQYVLIGVEAAALGAEPWLNWVQARPEMRLDATVFVARDRAAELILGAAGQELGSAEKLTSLETELSQLGEGYSFSLRTLASALAERDAGICGAVTGHPTTDTMPYEDADSLWPDGFALFRSGELVGFIEQNKAAGVLLLLGKCERTRIELSDAVLTAESGSVKTTRERNTVTLNAELTASVAEGTQNELDSLEQELADYAAAQLRAVVTQEQEYNADFFGLTDGAPPADTRFSIHVRARIDRENEGNVA